MVCYENQLVEKLRSLDTKNQLDFDLINKAIDWAKKYHDGQFRKSGEPFYTHPLQVAYLVSDYKLKTDVIVASILHDIIEDTEVTAGMLVDHFSWRIAEIVDRLTRDRPDGSKLSVEEILNNAYLPQDREVLLVKLLDRLHNMQSLSSLKKEKKDKNLRQTINEFLILSQFLEIPNVFHDTLSSFGFKLPPQERNFFSCNFQLASLELQSDEYQYHMQQLLASSK